MEELRYLEDLNYNKDTQQKASYGVDVLQKQKVFNKYDDELTTLEKVNQLLSETFVEPAQNIDILAMSLGNRFGIVSDKDLSDYAKANEELKQSYRGIDNFGRTKERGLLTDIVGLATPQGLASKLSQKALERAGKVLTEGLAGQIARSAAIGAYQSMYSTPSVQNRGGEYVSRGVRDTIVDVAKGTLLNTILDLPFAYMQRPKENIRKYDYLNRDWVDRETGEFKPNSFRFEAGGNELSDIDSIKKYIKDRFGKDIEVKIDKNQKSNAVLNSDGSITFSEKFFKNSDDVDKAITIDHELGHLDAIDKGKDLHLNDYDLMNDEIISNLDDAIQYAFWTNDVKVLDDIKNLVEKEYIDKSNLNKVDKDELKNKLNIFDDIKDDLQKAINENISFDDFKKQLFNKLQENGLINKDWINREGKEIKIEDFPDNLKNVLKNIEDGKFTEKDKEILKAYIDKYDTEDISFKDVIDLANKGDVKGVEEALKGLLSDVRNKLDEYSIKGVKNYKNLAKAEPIDDSVFDIALRNKDDNFEYKQKVLSKITTPEDIVKNDVKNAIDTNDAIDIKTKIPLDKFEFEKDYRKKIVKDIDKIIRKDYLDNYKLYAYAYAVDSSFRRLNAKNKKRYLNALKNGIIRSVLNEESLSNRFVRYKLDGNTIKYHSINTDALDKYIRKFMGINEDHYDTIEMVLKQARGFDINRNISDLNDVDNVALKIKNEQGINVSTKAIEREEYKKYKSKIDLKFYKSYRDEYERLIKELKIKPKVNNFKVYEFMEGNKLSRSVDKILKGYSNYGYIDFKNKKIYLSAGEKERQLVALIHEFGHLAFKDKTEQEIIDLSRAATAYLLKKSDKLRMRFKSNGTSKISIEEIYEHFNTNQKEVDEVLSYVFGNSDAVDIIFGTDGDIFKFIDELDNKTSEKIRNLIDEIAKSDFGVTIKDLFNKIYENSNFIRDIVFELKATDSDIRHLTSIKHKYHQIANIASSKVVELQKDFIKKHSKDRLNLLIKTGVIKDFDVNLKVLTNEKEFKKAYKYLVKKYKNFAYIYKNKKLDYLDFNPKIPYRYDHFKKLFGDDADLALNVIAGKFLRKIDNLDNLIKDYEILGEYAKNRFEKRVIGYYPKLLNTDFDIKIAHTKRLEDELKNNGYKNIENTNIYYKNDISDVGDSDILFVRDFYKRAGFYTTIAEDELKETILNAKKYKYKIFIEKIGKDRYSVRTTLSDDLLKEYGELIDDVEQFIPYIVENKIKEYYNNNFRKIFYKLLNDINKDIKDVISKEYKDGFVRLDENFAKFLSDRLFDEEIGELYVKEEYAPFFYTEKWLPKNEIAKRTFNIYKSFIGKYKWHLTGLSVSAYLNAIVSGITSLVYLGINPKIAQKIVYETIKEYKEFKKSLNGLNNKLLSKDEKNLILYINRLRDKNVFAELIFDGKLSDLTINSSILLGNGRNAIDREFYRAIAKVNKNIAKDITSFYRTLSFDKSSAIGITLLKAYGAIDIISRAMAYKALKQKYGKDEALRRVSDMFVDYYKPQSKTAQVMETVAPFFTWTIRMQGGLARMVADRPLSFAGMFGLYLTLEYLFDNPEFKHDEFAGDLRIESWFIHSVILDPLILETSIPNQLLEGRYGKLAETFFIPKTFDEAYNIVYGDRNPLEILGLNFKPEWLKKEELREKNKEEQTI